MPAPVGSHSPGPIDQVSDRSGTPRRSQVLLPHPGGPTTRYSAASVSVFFTDGIVFSLLRAGFSSRPSVENRSDPLYM